MEKLGTGELEHNSKSCIGYCKSSLGARRKTMVGTGSQSRVTALRFMSTTLSWALQEAKHIVFKSADFCIL